MVFGAVCEASLSVLCLGMIMGARPMAEARDVVLVRHGAFSGSALSLRDALQRHGLRVHDVDVTRYSRHPRLLVLRLLACGQAGLTRSWTRTHAWSQANQGVVERASPAPTTPTIFVQTVSAFSPRSAPYVVLTDRVEAEGRAESNTSFRVTSTPAWRERERSMLANARSVHVMGPTTLPFLQAHYGVPPDRCRVVGAAPNCVVTEEDAPRPGTRLLFVGTQWELKGGPTLIEAFRLLRHKRPDLTLTVVGCVPDVEDGVRLLGRVAPEEMDSVYSDADLLVLPTRSEAFGIAYVEALQKGIPCVGSQLGNIPWIVGSGGLTIPTDQPGPLADAISKIIDDYESWRQLALARGRELRRSWTWDSIAAGLIRDLDLTIGVPAQTPDRTGA